MPALLFLLLALTGTQTIAAPIMQQPDPYPSAIPGESDIASPDAAPTENSDVTEETGTAEESERPEPLAFPDWNAQQSAGERVRVGSSQKVGPDETVRELVTVLGSADMEGKVLTDMVTVFGNARMTGNVGHDMVTVFGDAEVDGTVNHDLVVVFGSLDLGPNAVINGNCTAVFGEIDRNPTAIVTNVNIPVIPQLAVLKDYIVKGPLLGRPLPPGNLLAWIVVGLHFILYFLVAVILPKPTATVTKQLDTNPLLCFGVGILTSILLFPLTLILMATGIGIVLLPLISLATGACHILGKTSILQFFGLQILRNFGNRNKERPILGFLTGFALVTLVYMVPVLGILVWLILRPLSLGAAVLAAFRAIKKNGNGNTAPGIPINPTPNPGKPYNNAADVPLPPPPTASAMNASASAGPGIGVPTTDSPEQPAAPDTQSEPFIEAEPVPPVMPRAGFWIRLAATALDSILLFWTIPFSGKYFLLIWLAYHIAMWSWKGTTIGGIICRLKVVRLDGSPLDFGVSLVRSLAAFFSAIALCLGFFWVGWTRARQSWHDMIAGTVIVRVPQSINLI